MPLYRIYMKSLLIRKLIYKGKDLSGYNLEYFLFRSLFRIVIVECFINFTVKKLK